MSDMPEKIYVARGSFGWFVSERNIPPHEHKTEYIRADLVEEMIEKALEERLNHEFRKFKE
jgi:hypothetical protein